MAVPRNRLSNSRKNMKRAHHAKRPKNASTCKNCGTPKLSHVLCEGCGHYGNRLVVDMKPSQGA